MQRHAQALLDNLSCDLRLIGLGGSQIHLLWWLPYALLRGLFAVKKVQLILVQDALLAPLGVLLGGLSKKPVIVVAHGLDVTWDHGWYRWPVHGALRRASRVVCVSRATRDVCIAVGLSEKNLVVIPNGVETHDGLGKREGAARILFVGRLVERKGIHWFLKEVVPKLSSEIGVDVVGEGPMRAELLKAVKDNDTNTNNVQLHGAVSEDQLRKLYSLARVVVMPNLPVSGDMEGFGISALEAGSWGIPVVASDMEGLQDAVENERTGLLVPSGDPERWQHAIEAALEWDQEKRRKIKEGVQERFNWKRIAGTYGDLILEVVQEGTKAGG